MKELKESILGGDLAERLADFDKMINLNDINLWRLSFRETRYIENFVYCNYGHIWFKKATEFMEQFAEFMKSNGVDLQNTSFRNGLPESSEISAMVRAYDAIVWSKLKQKGVVTLEPIYYKIVETMNSLCENKVIKKTFEFCNSKWDNNWDFPIYVKLVRDNKLRMEVVSGKNGIPEEDADAFVAAVQEMVSKKKTKYVKGIEVYDNRINESSVNIYLTLK